MNCKNCGEVVAIKYCSRCGQDSKVGKITLAKLSGELYEGIFQINKGFLYTLKELFIRPGNSIREYLNGKRKDHFKAIPYLLILSTIYFFVARATDQDTWMNDWVIGFYSGVEGTGSEAKTKLPPLITWFTNNYAYASLLFIPVFSLASYLCFLKKDANYLEHIVMNSYITGQQTLLYLIFALISTVSKNEIFEFLPLLLSISYCIYVFMQFFKNENKLRVIFFLILTYILFMIFSTLLLLAVLAIQEFI